MTGRPPICNSLLAGRERNDVFNYVENAIGAPVNKNNVFFENYPFPIFGEPRQPTIQVNRQGFEPLL